MKTGTIEDAEADLIIGADGAYSKVRKIMAKRPLFNCTQTYIEHGYVELSVPSGKNNEVSVVSYTYHISITIILIESHLLDLRMKVF